MDNSTIKDIQHRAECWEKGIKTGKDSERTWIFSVNIDDVKLLLTEIDRLQKALNETSECNHSCPNCTKTRVTLDETALEPDTPDGQIKYFFNIYTGPYKIADTQAERDYSWSRGPFSDWIEANEEWKAHCKREAGK